MTLYRFSTLVPFHFVYFGRQIPINAKLKTHLIASYLLSKMPLCCSKE